jgi:hypothetical protein
MKIDSGRYKGYLIDLVHNPPRWEANIYPESKRVRPLSPDLPPIHCKTKEEAFAEACKRIDEFEVG